MKGIPSQFVLVQLNGDLFSLFVGVMYQLQINNLEYISGVSIYIYLLHILQYANTFHKIITCVVKKTKNQTISAKLACTASYSLTLGLSKHAVEHKK